MKNPRASPQDKSFVAHGSDHVASIRAMCAHKGLVMGLLRTASFLALAALLQACVSGGAPSLKETDAAEIIESIVALRTMQCPIGMAMLCKHDGSMRTCGCVGNAALADTLTGAYGPGM